MADVLSAAQQVHVDNRAEWRAWLEANHTALNGIWLVFPRAQGGKRSLTYDEIVEEALCFGWVDSRRRKLDEQRTTLYVAPRKAGSGWSKVNKERVERLIEAGLITPAGLTKVDAAQRNGSWTSMDDIEALVMPDDLAAALAANPTAQRYFEAFPRSVKKVILYWVTGAKRPETRARRVEETVRRAAENQRAGYPAPRE